MVEVTEEFVSARRRGERSIWERSIGKAALINKIAGRQKNLFKAVEFRIKVDSCPPLDMRDAIIIRHLRYLDHIAVSALYFVAVFLCSFFRVATAAEPSSVAVGANTHLVRAAARSDTHAAPMALATADKVFQDAVGRHQTLLVKNDAGLTVLKGITRTGEGAVVSGIALVPATKGLSLFYSLGAYVLSKSVDKQIEAYSTEAKRLLNQKLAYDIRAFEQQSPQRWAALKAEGNPDTIYQALRETVFSIQSDPFANISPEQQHLVTKLYVNELGHAVHTGFSSFRDSMAVQADQIEQNTKDIQALSAACVAAAEHRTSELKEAAETQHSIQQDLQSLQATSNTQNIQFVHEFLFGQMTTSQQRDALRRGMFPNMPPADRAALDQKLGLLEKREKFAEQVGNIVSDAGEVLNIAKNLGVDSKILQPASEAVAIGNHIANGLTQFAAGNYLGAVSALSNVLGVGGSDAGAERQKQIMQALQAMYGRLGEMDEKLTTLLRGEQAIMESQRAIYDTLVVLSENVERNHVETMSKLSELRGDVLYNRDLILEPVQSQYANCQRFVREENLADNSIHALVDTASGIYPTYDEFAKLFRDRSIECRDCMDLYSKVWILDSRGDRGFNKTFALENAVSVAGVRDSLTIFQKILGVAKQLSETKPASVRNKWLNLSLIPSASVGQLEEKLARINAIPEVYASNRLKILLPILLSPDRVALHAELLKDFHFLTLLLDDENKPIKRELFENAQWRRLTGRNYLEDSAALLNISLIQQSLYGGDILLPDVYRLFAKGAKRSQEEQAAWAVIEGCLQRNSVFAQNLVMYGLFQEVRKAGTQVAYHAALGSETEQLLRASTIAPWQFAREHNGDSVGWVAVFGPMRVPLPLAAELMSGELIPTSEVPRLLRLRRRVAEEIVSYDLLGTASSDRSQDGTLRDLIVAAEKNL